MKANLHIEDETRGEVRIVHLVGILDGHTLIPLEKRLHEMRNAGSNRMILDLERLTYIASAGVGLFISMHSQLAAKGGSLQLLKPTATVREIFEILGLSELLAIHDKLENALESARAKP